MRPKQKQKRGTPLGAPRFHIHQLLASSRREAHEQHELRSPCRPCRPWGCPHPRVPRRALRQRDSTRVRLTASGRATSPKDRAARDLRSRSRGRGRSVRFAMCDGAVAMLFGVTCSRRESEPTKAFAPKHDVESYVASDPRTSCFTQGGMPADLECKRNPVPQPFFASSRLAQRLFSAWSNPPTCGVPEPGNMREAQCVPAPRASTRAAGC